MIKYLYKRYGRWLRAVVVVFIFGLQTGCLTTGESVAAAIGATLFGAQSPNNEIEQIYYLGVFDPQGQIPPLNLPGSRSWPGQFY